MPPLNTTLGLSTIGLAVLVSAVFYRHRGRAYALDKSQVIRSLPGSAAVARVVTIASAVVGALSFVVPQPYLLILHSNAWLVYLGCAFALASLSIFIWAKVTLGQHYSPCFDSFVPHSLVCRGPYARVRHPIYTANIALLCSFFMACGSLLFIPIIVVLAIYYVHSAIAEEARLSEALPGYAEYMTTTGRFIPRCF